MGTVLERYEVLRQGSEWSAIQESGKTIAGVEALAYVKYLDESDKFGANSPKAISEWKYLNCRGRRRNAVLQCGRDQG